MYLIVGCGFLGQYILNELQERSAEMIVATFRENKNDMVLESNRVKWLPFDVTRESDIAVLKRICGEEPLSVFYLASCHSIDYVFHNPRLAYQVNVSALDTFLQTFPHIESLFYASTDCVYGEGYGRGLRFKETDQTNPINVYGEQKKEAEQLVLQAGFHVARLPYLLGPSLSKTKSFYDAIVDDLSHARPVDMVDGLERSVLSYRQVARILVDLSQRNNIPSVINVAGDNSYTKYKMGCHIAKKLGYSEKYIVKASNQFIQKLFSDRRADSTVMDNQLLKSVLSMDRLDWECP